MALQPSKRRKTNGETLQDQGDAIFEPLNKREQLSVMELISSRFPTETFTSNTSAATPLAQAMLPYRGLSRELRDMIYDQLLYLPDGFRIEQSCRPPFGLRAASPLPLAILRANKQTWAEAQERLFAINEVILDTTSSLALQYLRSLDAESLKSIRRLQLHWKAIDLIREPMTSQELSDFVEEKMNLHAIAIACPASLHDDILVATTHDGLSQLTYRPSDEDSSWSFDTSLVADLCDMLLDGNHFAELRLVYRHYYEITTPDELSLVQTLRTSAYYKREMEETDYGRTFLNYVRDADETGASEESAKPRNFVATIEGDETSGTIIVLRRP